MRDSLLAENEKTLTGTVFNVQRFSLHDGPGLRSTSTQFIQSLRNFLVFSIICESRCTG